MATSASTLVPKEQIFQTAQERLNQDLILKTTRDAIYSFNERMDIFEAQPSLATAQSIRDRFNAIKSDWDRLKSVKTVPEIQNSCQIIDLSIENVEKRVAKFVEDNAHRTEWDSGSSKHMLMLRVSYEGYVTFCDALGDASSILSNIYPSPLTFGDKKYPSVQAVIEAIKSNEPSRFRDEQDLRTMMHILRAKFDQNPALKELLMATGTGYLVKNATGAGIPVGQSIDAIWDNGHDGNGRNLLGVCLMKLREEYGGTGMVEKPEKYTNLMALICKVPQHVNSSSSSASTPSLAGRCVLCKWLPSQGLGKGVSTCRNCATLVSRFNPNVNKQ